VRERVVELKGVTRLDLFIHLYR